MRLLIVTGLSGAGKTLVGNALEDIGYNCVDNLPPKLLRSYCDQFSNSGGETNLAAVIDVRTGESFGALNEVVNQIKGNGVDVKLLFLGADLEVLERRYKETRRRHPLQKTADITLENALLQESKMLSPFYENADYFVDTSHTSTASLRELIVSLFGANTNFSGLQLNIISFGYKNGIPRDADLVFDVRCLENPFYVEGLRNKTGKDEEVYDFVFSNDVANEFYIKILDMLKFTLPLYVKEGKSLLTVAVGCTGGKHRSVAFCERLTRDLKNYNPYLVHRDFTAR